MHYQIRRARAQDAVVLRDLKFQFYRWSGVDRRPLLLLHGWGDTGETFQFLAEHMPQRTLIAFDARGFGLSERPHDGYWFADYLADLDAIFDLLSPDAPLDLVGHSMGGNVAMLYAGVRSERVSKLVSLEGFGMSRTAPEQAPARYREWLDEVKHGVEYATYDSFEQLTKVLGRRFPQTSAPRLDFIARSWAWQRQDGRIELRADPKHKRVNPMLYQRDQAEACWREIAAPVLLVAGERSEFAKRAVAEFTPENLRSLFRNATLVTIPGAGHMMHHEQPEQVAAAIQSFLGP
jgi:pimeloyl-ACP methyl ester carboxylesterase